MCDRDLIYKQASPALRDLLHEYPELEAAIRKHADFLGIDFVEREDPDDADDTEIATIH